MEITPGGFSNILVPNKLRFSFKNWTKGSLIKEKYNSLKQHSSTVRRDSTQFLCISLPLYSVGTWIREQIRLSKTTWVAIWLGRKAFLNNSGPKLWLLNHKGYDEIGLKILHVPHNHSHAFLRWTNFLSCYHVRKYENSFTGCEAVQHGIYEVITWFCIALPPFS